MIRKHHYIVFFECKAVQKSIATDRAKTVYRRKRMRKAATRSALALIVLCSMSLLAHAQDASEKEIERYRAMAKAINLQPQ